MCQQTVSHVASIIVVQDVFGQGCLEYILPASDVSKQLVSHQPVYCLSSSYCLSSAFCNCICYPPFGSCYASAVPTMQYRFSNVLLVPL